jgi:hypothetical protein
MASNGKDRTSGRNQREFRTVDIDLNLGGGEKSHEFAVRSVEDDQLYVSDTQTASFFFGQ